MSSLECSICKRNLALHSNWEYGNNAWPINSGRCCDACNLLVIEARIREMQSNAKIDRDRKA